MKYRLLVFGGGILFGLIIFLIGFTHTARADHFRTPNPSSWTSLTITLDRNANPPTYTLRWSPPPGIDPNRGAHYFGLCEGLNGATCTVGDGTWPLNQIGGNNLYSGAGPFEVTQRMDAPGSYKFQLQASPAQGAGEFFSNETPAVEFASNQPCNVIGNTLPAPTNVSASYANNAFTIDWEPIQNCRGVQYQVDQVIDDPRCILPGNCSRPNVYGRLVDGPTVVVPTSALLGGLPGFPDARPPFKFCVIAILGSGTPSEVRSNWQAGCSATSFDNDGQGGYNAVSGPGSEQAECNCPSNIIQRAICEASCAVSKALGGIVEFFVRGLLNAAGVSWNPELRLASTCWVSTIMSALVPTAHAQTINPPPQTNMRLVDQLRDEATSQHKWVFAIWRIAISLVNVGVVLFIVFIALATILHWNIETYGFKKALPTLVLGVILANFSLLISRALVDVASILTIALADKPEVLTKGLIDALGLTNVTGVGGIMAGIVVSAFFPPAGLLTLLAGIILVFLPAILVGILWFLLIVRIGIVLILAAISPLAFAALGFTGTQPWFRRWWSMYLNWVFMAPVVFFLLAIVSRMGGIANIQTSGAALLVYFMAIGVMWFAIQVPFKMGGAIMAAWGGLGKAAAGLGWKGYGSTLAKGKSWTSQLDEAREANKRRREAGQAELPISRWMELRGGLGTRMKKIPNVYGVRQAFQERGERMEKSRMDTFKGTAYYEATASKEAALAHHLKEKKEITQDWESQEVQDRFQGMLKDNPTYRRLSEPQKRALLSSGASRISRLMNVYGINNVSAEDMGWINGLARRAQQLERQRQEPPPLESIIGEVEAGNWPEMMRARKPRRGGPYGGDEEGVSPIGGGSQEAGLRASGLDDTKITLAMQRLREGHEALDIAKELGIGARVTPSGQVDIYDQEKYRGFEKAIREIAGGDEDIARIFEAQARTIDWVKAGREKQWSPDIRARLESSYRTLDADIRKASAQEANVPPGVLEQHVKLMSELHANVTPTMVTQWRANPEILKENMEAALRASNVLGGGANLTETQVKAKVRQSVVLDREIQFLRGRLYASAGNTSNYEQAAAQLDKALGQEGSQARQQIDTHLRKIAEISGQPLDTNGFIQTIRQKAKQLGSADDLLAFSEIRDALRTSTMGSRPSAGAPGPSQQTVTPQRNPPTS